MLTVTASPASFATVHHPADLSLIVDPNINCVVWERGAPGDLAPAVSGIVLPQAVLATVSADERPPLLQVPAALRPDVQFLLDLFADLTGAETVGLRLASLNQPMCPGFHVDHVALRLVCTYDGPGSEFLANDAVDRRHLGTVPPTTPDAENPILQTLEHIQRMPAFAVGLLKGESWTGNHGRGVVHRSPPRGAAPYHRLLLTLDWLS
jgi:hypothetical protein